MKLPAIRIRASVVPGVVVPPVGFSHCLPKIQGLKPARLPRRCDTAERRALIH